MSEAFPMDLVGELVAVRPDAPEGGVLLPDWQRGLTGRVLAVGPGRELLNGTRAPMSVQVGDRVRFGAAVGMESTFNGEPLRVMRDSDIDMVLE